MVTDYSRKIYDKFFNSKDKILVITLKDNTVLEGILVGYYHGDTQGGDPFVIKWHFIDKKDMETYHKGLDVSLESNQDVGRIIKQKDIKNVRFKE